MKKVYIYEKNGHRRYYLEYRKGVRVMKVLDWRIAEEHLKKAEEAYTEIGPAGYFTLNYVIRPLRDRFNAGERTEELYDLIMGIAL